MGILPPICVASIYPGRGCLNAVATLGMRKIED
jgi:hypothetical protein